MVSDGHRKCGEWIKGGALQADEPTRLKSYFSLLLRISQGASLGDFLLAPACPIEKVTLWVSLLY